MGSLVEDYMDEDEKREESYDADDILFASWALYMGEIQNIEIAYFLHWKLDLIQMYIQLYFCKKQKCKIREKRDFVEISSHVEISDWLKFTTVWKYMHETFKRCISFRLIITGEKNTHFLLSTWKMLVW